MPAIRIARRTRNRWREARRCRRRSRSPTAPKSRAWAQTSRAQFWQPPRDRTTRPRRRHSESRSRTLARRYQLSAPCVHAPDRPYPGTSRRSPDTLSKSLRVTTARRSASAQAGGVASVLICPFNGHSSPRHSLSTVARASLSARSPLASLDRIASADHRANRRSGPSREATRPFVRAVRASHGPRRQRLTDRAALDLVHTARP